MFDFNYGSYYNYLCSIYGEDEAFSRYKQNIGKLVIVSANDDNTTRLFIRSMCEIIDEKRKNGWWNTFTISKKPFTKGLYICRIDEVRQDKDGYPIFVVNPVKEINEDTYNSDEIRNLFLLSQSFIQSGGSSTDYNFRCLVEEANNIDSNIDIWYYYIFEPASKIVDLYINDKIDTKTIINCLNQPTKYQIAQKNYEDTIREFVENLDNHKEKYPLFVTKVADILPDWFSMKWFDHYLLDIERLIDDLMIKYEIAVDRNHMEAVYGTSFDKIEVYLTFDKARKEANKAAKKAAKKAKKTASKNKKEN